MRKTILLIAILAIALTVAACGGGGGDEAAPAATTAPQAGAGEGEQAAPAAGNAGNGEALFAQTVLAENPGCITCHSLSPDTVIVGPNMLGIGSRAANAVPGLSAEEYLRTSIVEPNAHISKGCNASDLNADCPSGVMPQNWSEKLNEGQINDLVAYMLSLQ